MILGSDDPTKTRWAISCNNFVKSTISNLEIKLDKIHYSMPKKVEIPLSSGYESKIDSSRELNPRQITFYQGLIGTIRWIYELGRIDILMPV